MALELNRKVITVLGRWVGWEHSIVSISDTKYLERWLLYVGFGSLRLHKFFRGDDDRASHTHPWWFVTFPLVGYFEELFSKGVPVGTRYVKPFRFHFRPADFEHVVLGRRKSHYDWSRELYDPRPFYTFVIAGHRTNAWGFYPKPNQFVPWREYT